MQWSSKRRTPVTLVIALMVIMNLTTHSLMVEPAFADTGGMQTRCDHSGCDSALLKRAVTLRHCHVLGLVPGSSRTSLKDCLAAYMPDDA